MSKNENGSLAPKIYQNGDKMSYDKGNGKFIAPHDVMSAIMNGLGPRDAVMLKIMFYLVGNAEGFRVSEKNITERCNISTSKYRENRTKLINMGWITHVPYKSITVNYEKIMQDYYDKQNTSRNEMCKQEKEKNHTSRNDMCETSHKGMCGTSRNEIHNNIKNNINNNIKEKNSVGEIEVKQECDVKRMEGETLNQYADRTFIF